MRRCGETEASLAGYLSSVVVTSGVFTVSVSFDRCILFCFLVYVVDVNC